VEHSYCGVSREEVAEGLEQAAILMVRHMSDRTALNLTGSSAPADAHLNDLIAALLT
jgi:hypothetical protein